MRRITQAVPVVIATFAIYLGSPLPAAGQWQPIGHANDTIDVTAADGLLFAVTTDNKLWIREIRHEDIPWRHIGHANNLAALATADGRLYAATRDNKLWVRSTVRQDVPWAYIGDAGNARAMAGVGTRLFAATADNRLWSKDLRSKDPSWQPAGHANNVVAMAAIGETLYAATADNLLWKRTASLADIPWRRVGAAANLVGMTAAGGRLYATTKDNKLLVMTPMDSKAALPAVQSQKVETPKPQAKTDPAITPRKPAQDTDKSTGSKETRAAGKVQLRDGLIRQDRFSVDQVAAAVTSRGSRTYQFIVLGDRTNRPREYRQRPQQVQGLLLMRDTTSMTPVGYWLFDDGQGDLVSSGYLAGRHKQRIAYTLTLTPWGENAFAADHDADGVIDVAVGSRGRDRLWLLGQDDLAWLRVCFEQSDVVALAGGEIQAAALCTQCLSPERSSGPLTSEEQGCLKERADGSGRGGSLLGGAVPGASSFLEPNCGARRPGAGLTSDWFRQRAREHERQSHAYEAIASVARASEEGRAASAAGVLRDLHSQAAEAYRSAAAHEDKALALFLAGDRDGAQEMRDAGYRDELRARKIEDKIYDAEAGFAAMATSFETGEDVRPEDIYPPQPHGFGSGPGGGTSQPGIGPDGSPEMAFEDPRCGSSSAAFWEICGKADTNIMDCSRNLGDSAYALTGGQCRTEPGPDDEDIVICYGQQVDREPRDPGDGRPSTGGAGSGLAEGRMPRTGGGAPGRMIDYVPLGGFILALCSRGGCPDPALRETGDRTP